MKKLLFLAIFGFITTQNHAQFNWARPYFEVGLIAGVSNYSGELVNSIIDFKHLHPAGGLFLRYNMNKYITLRAQGVYGAISGDDMDSKDARNRIRNLHFRSHILEFGVFGEFNMMGFNPQGNGKMFSPYAFLGFSVFNFNPQARNFDPNVEDGWIDLQGLHTEGQELPQFPDRKAYSLTQVSIPMGVGFKFAVHSNFNIGFEIGFRKTFTDYLDDVGFSYALDAISGQSYYNQSPYRAGQYMLVENIRDNDGNIISTNPIRELSLQEMMSDGTYFYVMDANSNVDIETYQRAAAERGRDRGDKAQDWYLITGITVSYNFTDEGLRGARQRRKKKAGCKSAQF